MLCLYWLGANYLFSLGMFVKGIGHVAYVITFASYMRTLVASYYSCAPFMNCSGARD